MDAAAHGEQQRLDALRAYEILDSAPEEEFDRLTRLAASICEVPIALVTMVDAHRQWFKSVVGLEERETDRAVAFCAVGIAQREPLVVPDATRDERFAANPMVRGGAGIRFYACVPLLSPAGFAIGTLAVIDRMPRWLRVQQLQALETLAQQVMLQLEHRRQRRVLERFDAERDELLQQLRHQAGMLQAAGRLARVGGWVADLAAGTLAWSPEAAAIHEVAFTTIPLPEASDYYAPECRGRLVELFAACARDGTPFDEEFELITARGRRVWVRTIGEAERDAAGVVTHIRGALQDTSERKHAERRLSLSEQSFRTLADAVPQIVWTALPDGTVDYANQAMYNYTGLRALSQGEIEWVEALHPDDAPAVLRGWQAGVAAGRASSFEYRLRQISNGAYRWMLARAEPVRDDSGQIVKWYGTVTDIHDRKMAEQQAHSEAQIRLDILHIQQDVVVAAEQQELAAALELMAERARQLLHGDGGEVALIEAGALVVRAAAGPTTGGLGRRLQLGASLSGLVISEGVPMASQDALTDARVDQTLARNAGVRAMVVAPLRAGREPIGVLAVTSARPHAFSPADVAALQVLGESLGAVIERRRHAELVLASATQYRLLFEHNPHPMWVYDPLGLRMLAVNRSALAHYGYSAEEFLALTVDALWDPAHAQSHSRSLEAIANGQRTVGALRSHRKKDGSPIAVEISADAIRFDGRDARLVLAYDVTDREQALAQQQQLQNAVRKMAAAVSSQSGAAFFDGLVRYMAEAVGAQAGFVARLDASDGAGTRTVSGVVNGLDATQLSYPLADTPCAALLVSDTLVVPEGLAAHYPHAPALAGLAAQAFVGRRLLSSTGAPLGLLFVLFERPLQQPELIASTLQIFAARAAAEMEREQTDKRLHEQAFHDALTGLPNRQLLHDRLQLAQASGARTGRRGALLFIDLDNFKTLNDTLGHDKGDALLCQVGLRLTACVRETDTVARFGGDEFLVLLQELSSREAEAANQARAVGEKMLAVLGRPYALDGYEHLCTPSIGVAPFLGHEVSAGDLLKQTDLAMYQAKAAGRNTLRFFDPQMQHAVSARALLEADLRQALADRAFVLHYQPQAAADGRVTGFEALVRWRHATRGMVSPAEFIPLSEETGLILELGRWVLESACALLAVWRRQPAMAGFTVAVNVSPRQFQHPDFAGLVLSVLDRTGADPTRLKLELTEGMLVHDIETVITRMGVLKARGVAFSLDDFGTGYSSLAYLKRLPLDQLKIDQSFVRDVLTNANDAAIAGTIIALGQNLGLDVVAEGVETEAQRQFLMARGCHGYQGYLLSRPLPPEQLAAFLTALHPDITVD